MLILQNIIFCPFLVGIEVIVIDHLMLIEEGLFVLLTLTQQCSWIMVMLFGFVTIWLVRM